MYVLRHGNTCRMSDSHSHTDLFLSCDWGTTSFRLKLVDTNSGEVLESIATSEGIKKTYNALSEEEKNQDFAIPYLRYLKEHISLLADKFKQSLSGIPVILSGMASSSIGIKELPYTSLPFSLTDSSLELETVSQSDKFPYDLILVSGLRTKNDIMRGEETQILGLSGIYDLEYSACILTGTHSKHIFIENNHIVDFKTFMTGELFELILTKSILKNSTSARKKEFHKKAFQEGVHTSLNQNILHSLFEIRAGDILRNTDPVANYDFLSGLLIGTELSLLDEHASQKIILVGEKHLQQRYSAALTYLEYAHIPVKDKDELTVEGHRIILNNISP